MTESSGAVDDSLAKSLTIRISWSAFILGPIAREESPLGVRIRSSIDDLDQLVSDVCRLPPSLEPDDLTGCLYRLRSIHDGLLDCWVTVLDGAAGGDHVDRLAHACRMLRGAFFSLQTGASPPDGASRVSRGPAAEPGRRHSGNVRAAGHRLPTPAGLPTDQ